jgi:hypothetical protein
MREHKPRDLRGVCYLEEQLECLGQIRLCLCDRGALAGDVGLGEERDVHVALTLDDRSEVLGLSHAVMKAHDLDDCG